MPRSRRCCRARSGPSHEPAFRGQAALMDDGRLGPIERRATPAPTSQHGLPGSRTLSGGSAVDPAPALSREIPATREDGRAVFWPEPARKIGLVRRGQQLHALEFSLPSAGEDESVGAPVARGGSTPYQAATFEPIQQAHEARALDAQPLRD